MTKILGVKVDKTSPQSVVKKVDDFLRSHKKFYIVTPNPEIILKAQKDQKLKEIINKAQISLPDGMGLKLGNPTLKIIKGRELMDDLFQLANARKLRVYFLGGSADVNKKAQAVAQKLYPNMKVNGHSGPQLDSTAVPINEANQTLNDSVISKINKFDPDIIFVAFGAPKQEYWIDRHLKSLKAGGAMVVGGSLDSLISSNGGLKFMSGIGLEWLWRLFNEPKRIGRIFNAVVLFPSKLILSKFSK